MSALSPSQVFAAMSCQESLDLIVCLRVIVYIYMTPAENVVKVRADDTVKTRESSLITPLCAVLCRW